MDGLTSSAGVPIPPDVVPPAINAKPSAEGNQFVTRIARARQRVGQVLQQNAEFLPWIIITAFSLGCTLSVTRGGILVFDDGWFPFSPASALSRNLSVWNYPEFPGAPSYGTVFYMPFIVSIYGFSSLASLPLQTSDFLYIFALTWTGACGTYLLVRNLLPTMVPQSKPASRLVGPAALMASFFFTFNYFQLRYLGGEFYQGFVLVHLIPIFLYLAVTYVQGKVGKLSGSWRLGGIYLVGTVMAGGYWEAPFVLWTAVLVFIVLVPTLVVAPSIGLRRIRVTIRGGLVFLMLALSALWTSLALYYNSTQAFSANYSQLSGGLPVFLQEYNSVDPGPLATSLLNGFFGPLSVSGQYLIGYPIFNVVLSNPVLILVGFAPLFVALIPLLTRGARTTTVLFYSTSLLLLVGTTSRLIDLTPLLTAKNFATTGIAFSMFFFYSTYPLMVLETLLLGAGTFVVLNRLVPVTRGRPRHDTPPVTREYIVHSQVVMIRTSVSMGRRTARRVASIAVILLVSCLVIYSTPVLLDPQVEWQYGNLPPISGTFNPPQSFGQTVSFLDAHTNDTNVAVFPIQVGESTVQYGGSGYTSNNDPLLPGSVSTMLDRDPSITTSSFSYPLLRYFPSTFVRNLTNYLDALGVGFITVNTAAYPSFVEPSVSDYAQGYPFNYTGILSALNTTPGIVLAAAYLPYYVYEMITPPPIIYGAQGIAASSLSSPPTPMTMWNLLNNNTIEALRQAVIEGINSTTSNASAPSNVSYTMINPDTYSVRVGAIRSFFLVFDSGFNINWTISAPANDHPRHYRANGYANAWEMPSGNYTVIIQYKYHNLQSDLFLATGISLPIVLGLTVIGLWSSRRKTTP